MALDIEKLRQSFRTIFKNGEALASSFYEGYFESFPEAAPLFENVSLPEQRRKLIYALSLAMRNIDKPEVFNIYLEGLGAAHVAYGVKEHHYPAMRRCLLSGLEKAAGDAWDPETARVWSEFLDLVTATMLTGVTRPPLVIGPK